MSPSRRLTSMEAGSVPLSLHAQEWDERVAREGQHQALVEAAFDRADACERLGECERALEWLDRADAQSGGLSPASRAQRARLTRELARRQAPAAGNRGARSGG